MKNNPKLKTEKLKQAVGQSKQAAGKKKTGTLKQVVERSKKSTGKLKRAVEQPRRSAGRKKPEIEPPRQTIKQHERTRETSKPTTPQAPLPGVFTSGLRHPWLVLGSGLLFALLAVGLAAMLPPAFEATARLYIDPRDLQVVENPLTSPSETQNIAVTLVESQALVLDSDAIRMQTAEKLDLANDPEFNGQRRTIFGSLVTSASSLVDQLVGRSKAAQDPRDIVLDNLARAVNVYRMDRSYVILVSAKAETGDKARAIVDSLVTFYLDDQSRWRAELAKRSSRDLGAGIGPLRETVKTWEGRVTRYKETHDLIGVLGQIVTEQQFADLNSQLNKARAEAGRLQARLEATPLRADTLGQLPEAVGSTTLGNLRVLHARISQRKANLESQFMARHPLMRSIDSSERQVIRQVNAELARIRESISIDNERARTSEAELAGQLEELSAKVRKAKAAQIGLRELERELAAAQNVYNQAITRAKEAGEQARLDTTNVRVISPARRVRGRAFPPPLSLVGVIGFLLGTILALFFLHLWGMARQQRAG